MAISEKASHGLLRFITCGSVDDGKSTLIGRLLYDSDALPEDQLAALERDSLRWGTSGQGGLNLALALDGLSAEREQGITIDVAYRYFSVGSRRVIVADTPGHEQYTRNMVTGASTADLAVLLVDARKGLLTQTRRHSHLVALVGIQRVVLAVNKMDLMDFEEAAFREIESTYLAFASGIGLSDVTAIPVSALSGDNVSSRSLQMPWYDGPTLLQYLAQVELDGRQLQEQPLRVPIQMALRPDATFRGYAGWVASGTLQAGQRALLQPSGRQVTVGRIVSMEGNAPLALAGEAVTFTLEQEVDAGRGEVLTDVHSTTSLGDVFECSLVWMSETALKPGAAYLLKIMTTTVGARVVDCRHRLDLNSFQPDAADTLRLNDIGVCLLALDRPVPFDPYVQNRSTGGFILIDPVTNETVAAGMLRESVRETQAPCGPVVTVNQEFRARLKGQRPVVLWMTGLSGAGKTTLARRVEQALAARGRHTYVLDGDLLRHGLNRDLGFSPSDRTENIRRAAEVVRLMVDAGLVVLAAFISPLRSDRALAREKLPDGDFIEIHVDAPLHVVEHRDVKGLYAKARRGELKQFTGINAPYEPPEHPELRIDTAAMSVDQAVQAIMDHLREKGVLSG